MHVQGRLFLTASIGSALRKADVVHAEDVPVGLMPNQRVLRPSSLRNRSLGRRKTQVFAGALIFCLGDHLSHEPILLTSENL